MGDQQENKMTAKIVRDLEKMKIPKFLVIRIVPGIYGSMKGKSDLLFCYHGRFVAIEMKISEDKEPTPLQSRFLKQVKDAGGFSYVCFSKQGVIDALAETLKKIQEGNS